MATLLEEEYNIIQTLYRNEITVINEVVEKFGGKNFVSKQVLKTDLTKPKLRWETDLLEEINHPNIVKLHHWDENEHHVFMIFEKMDEDLFSFMGEFLPEPESIHVITQILEGVLHLHTNNILHRDLKVENILCKKLKDGSVSIVIADLGFAIYTNDPVSDPVGTTHYAAPEVFTSSYGKPVDIWAIGVISYAILTGRFPFYHDNNDGLASQIIYTQVVWPEESDISQNAKDFVESLLQKQPSERLTIKQALNHPFITG